MIQGGFGFLSRMHGLSIDNLVEVEMVLADGSIVIVNEKDYPGKLHFVPMLCSAHSVDPRPLVGITGSRPCIWYRHSLQSQGSYLPHVMAE